MTAQPYARPLAHLAEAARRYPSAWVQYDLLRDARAQLGDWPGWCFCPLSGAYAVVSGGRDAGMSTAQVPDVGRLGALAAWRPTQGTYCFDPTLLEALWTTPVQGEIPVEVLTRLPEWCVWIEAPVWTEILGYFAHLEHDANTGRRELRLVLDFGGPVWESLLYVPLHLDVPGGLAGAVEAMLRESTRQRLAGGIEGPPLPPGDPEDLAKLIAPLVSTLLYLCTDAPDLRGPRPPGAYHPEPKRVKSGWRLFAPDHPAVWSVGATVGEVIRTARWNQPPATPTPGTHASPRPHVRRAHWHTYWTGPRKGVQVPRLLWIPPLPINLGEE